MVTAKNTSNVKGIFCRKIRNQDLGLIELDFISVPTCTVKQLSVYKTLTSTRLSGM